MKTRSLHYRTFFPQILRRLNPADLTQKNLRRICAIFRVKSVRNKYVRQFAKIFTVLLCVTAQTVAMACPVCEKQQPRLLRGITHGAGPESEWDWIIVGISLTITLYTFFRSLKLLVRPGENEQSHIKQSILF